MPATQHPISRVCTGWLLQKAVCLAKLGRITQAEQLADRLSHEAMTTPYQCSAMGMLLTQLNRRSEAVGHYEKAAAMDKILRAYIKEVDGGDVTDSYRAFYETMDEFERREAETFRKKMADLKAGQPDDFEKQKAELIAAHEMKQRHFFANRAITRAQETWPP